MAPSDTGVLRWLALADLPGIGPVGAWRLLARAEGRIESLFEHADAVLASWGLNEAQRVALRRPPKMGALAHDWMQRPDHHLLTPDHPLYPPLLREIPAAPLLLWCRGRVEALSTRQLAVVGSRHPTFSGKENARRLVQALVAAKVAITSGLALGIDGVCHEAALDAGGITLAVLGSGLDSLYPKRHLALAERIVAQGGVLVSEFFPQQGPLAEHFPRRNRIISGLALGTLVIEAAEQSGSLITARHALEQGRDVFAVPGALQNPQALGCNRLIQQGAKLVLDIADIVGELGWPGAPVSMPASMPEAEPPGLLSISLLDNVDYETTSVDVVAARAGLSIESVIGQLVELELAGLVTSVAGGYVRRGG